MNQLKERVLATLRSLRDEIVTELELAASEVASDLRGRANHVLGRLEDELLVLRERIKKTGNP